MQRMDLHHGRRKEQNRLTEEAHHFVGLLRSCTKRKDLSTGTKLHADAFQRGLLDLEFPYIGNTLITMYAKCGSLAKAKHVLLDLPSRNIVSWNALMSGYVRQGQTEETFSCFDQMQRDGIAPDAITFTYILNACDTLERGKQIHGEIDARNLLGKDVMLGTALVDMYIRHGELGKAQEVLEKLPVRDIVMWSTLISGYVRHGQGETALNCFGRMQHEGLSPSNIIFTFALKACGIAKAIDKGKEIHDYIVSTGLLENDIVLGTALVDMYCRCGALVKAQEILNGFLFRDVVVWNTLISEYVKNGQFEDVFSSFKRMQNEGLSPDTITFACILKACGIKGELGRGKYAHSVIYSMGFLGKGAMLGTALVDMYAKCAAVMLAQQVFDELPFRDVVSWSALISGYVQQGQCENSLKCFEQMEKEYLCPNEITFSCILKACGSIGAINKGREIHGKMVTKGLLGKDNALGNALVDMYAICGDLLEAKQVFDELLIRDAVAWSALISGYTRKGQVEEVLNCIEDMKSEGWSPDLITFACILKACASIGLVSKGKEIHYEIVRKELHRKDIVLDTAIVDMYAKCGMPERALRLHIDLPHRDVFSWSALIAGYAQHGMDQKALVCLEEMQYEGLPKNPVAYLGVLNALCHSGLVDQAQMFFAKMVKEYGIIPELEHYICIIDLFGRAGQIEKAIAVIKGMPFSDCPAVWGSLLGACQKWRNVNLGRLAFKNILQLNIYNDAAYISMCSIYAATNMLENVKTIKDMRAKLYYNDNAALKQ